MTHQEFERLTGTLRKKLLAISARFVERTDIQDEAEDIVQDSLLTLWRLSEEGYPIQNAEALAVRIVKNNCVACFRRQKIRRLSIDKVDVSGGSPASEIVDTADRAKIAEMLFGNLSPTQQKYLKMRNEEGLSLDEIAEMTGSPKASVKTSISVARKQMLEILKTKQL